MLITPTGVVSPVFPPGVAPPAEMVPSLTIGLRTLPFTALHVEENDPDTVTGKLLNFILELQALLRVVAVILMVQTVLIGVSMLKPSLHLPWSEYLFFDLH